MKKELIIYWKTKKPEVIEKIRKRFRLEKYMTINREQPANISERLMPDLIRTEELGYIEIRTRH